MQLVSKFEIKSKDKMIAFLNDQPVGRIASTDKNGYPQVIPMNFVWWNDAVYMHSHPMGEKIGNIRRNPKVGFEVDKHVCFLPSYYFHPTDASQADTLYISIVIKGKATLVEDTTEKASVLNALMEKYQKEGRYRPLEAEMPVVAEVAIIKITPSEMRGKYKIGQHWSRPYRLKIAKSIIEREGQKSAQEILSILGIEAKSDSLVILEDKVM